MEQNLHNLRRIKMTSTNIVKKNACPPTKSNDFIFTFYERKGTYLKCTVNIQDL